MSPGPVRQLAALLLTGAVCLVGWNARAENETSATHDDPIMLSWSAPVDGECPDAAHVLGEIRRYVGPAKADRKPIRATVSIRRAGAGVWQMVMKTEQGSTQGERSFRDASCGAISDAAVVVLAWMIDPDAMADQTRPASAVAPAPTPPEAPAKPTVTVQPAPAREAIAPFAEIAVAGDAGTLPSASSGVELRVGASMRPVRVAGHGAYWPSSSKTVSALEDGTPVGGTFSLLAVGLDACFEAPFLSRSNRAELDLCAGPELDLMRGRSFGVNVPGEGSKAWVSAVVGVEGRVPVAGPWRISARLDGVFAQQREHFALQGIGQVHQAAFVAGRAALGLAVVF